MRTSQQWEGAGIKNHGLQNKRNFNLLSQTSENFRKIGGSNSGSIESFVPQNQKYIEVCELKKRDFKKMSKESKNNEIP